jgi:glyoxalase family protein
MATTSAGIHHITAIAADPQENLDFYGGILGLRFLKKTVNFDDPGTYHFYYGDYQGTPGTILTFFPWGSAAARGRPGIGQAVSVRFSLVPESFWYWKQRLSAFGLQPQDRQTPFGERVLSLHDPDGIAVELVENPEERREGWASSSVPPEQTIRGFLGVGLAVGGYEGTASLLTEELGFEEGENRGEVFRYHNRRGPGDTVGPTVVDIFCRPTSPEGRMGTGAIHHVAWRVGSDAEQVEIRGRLLKRGLNVTPSIDRHYFHSIYFREPGGILFEVATDPPGFAVDEPLENLGADLMLPPQHEGKRSIIEELLPEVTVPENVQPEKKI